MIPLPVRTRDPNILALSRFVRETRTASVAAAWPLQNRILDGFELVYKNGLLLEPTIDYSVSGKTITFVIAPLVGDRTTVVYYFAAN